MSPEVRLGGCHRGTGIGGVMLADVEVNRFKGQLEGRAEQRNVLD